MTTVKYLHNKLKINNVKDLQPDYDDGTLVLTESQAVIDECVLRKIPVAGIETTTGESLNCQQIIIDVDELEDEEDVQKAIELIRTRVADAGEDDLEALFDLYNEPHMTDYMEPLYEYEEEKDYERKYIEYIYKLYGFGMWLIFDRFTGKLIGRAGIEVRDTCDRENQAELGFAISHSRWHQGLAYEVCAKIVELARDEYSLSSLIARCDSANVASMGLLTKLGFSQVGYEENGDLRFFREI